MVPANVYWLDQATERRLVLRGNFVASKLLNSLLGTVHKLVMFNGPFV